MRILVCDDHALFREGLELVIGQLGDAVELIGVGDAEAALAHVDADEDVDLVLLDLQLPGMDGLTFARLLRANPDTRDLVIVAVTAHAMMSDEQAALAAGCDGFITKPIDTRALPARVAQFLALATGRS